ncbi:MAG: beta-ketoacyl synthase N-terminal-like domain-containing protein [Thermodesulfobacteriota bacterium]|nr:beta-ketoacyl synthase N-terminal-like domain-containing protein [Thermodesulfobacteriota bacterium]
MKSAAVVATKAITSLGNLDETWSGLMEGRSAIACLKSDGFFGKWPVGFIKRLEGELGTAKRLQALIKLLFVDSPLIPDDTTLILAITKGAPDELLSGSAGPRPGQPCDTASYIARELGLKGPVSTISAACASGTMAVIQGVHRIISGDAKTVAVIGIDILSRFVLAGFASLMAHSSQPCRPFDHGRDGLSLGEGAGIMLLCATEEAHKRNWPILARITGWGAACDAVHITAPDREASGLIASIKKATDNCRRQVGAINAHGTGTRHNDAMEICAFTTLWGKNNPPFHSVKGAIGHCLGAAGVIEAVLSVESLKRGLIPPSVGLTTPESGIGHITGQKPLALDHPSILSCNSGFGGINASIYMEAKPPVILGN